jgi:hypothetical protein
LPVVFMPQILFSGCFVHHSGLVVVDSIQMSTDVWCWNCLDGLMQWSTQWIRRTQFVQQGSEVCQCRCERPMVALSGSIGLVDCLAPASVVGTQGKGYQILLNEQASRKVVKKERAKNLHEEKKSLWIKRVSLDVCPRFRYCGLLELVLIHLILEPPSPQLATFASVHQLIKSIAWR